MSSCGVKGVEWIADLELALLLRVSSQWRRGYLWQLIGSLGCESIANLPIVVGGQTIGAFNLLHEAGYYTAERLARVDEVTPFATMAYLAAVFGERSSNTLR